ncbi:MAG: hypothetical protein V2I97_05020 [Desulfococcaceae bacterium]|jgi:hypothetical protein|nr:hypothetical protein [Desulfococcaceae bacterium]
MLKKITDAIDDHLNPIVVRELRQAVQSRLLAGILMLFLLIMLLAMAAAVTTDSFLSAANHRTGGMGRDTFEALFGILVFATILFVPGYTGIRMGMERSAENMDLLFSTAISPGAVIRGKLYAGMVISLLFFSVCLPFMTFTYFLRGVDLPSVFITLSMAFIGITAAIQFALCMGCNSSNRLAGMVLILITFGLLISGGSAIMGTAKDMLRSGIGSRIGTGDFWMTASLGLLLTGLFMGLFYVLAKANISPSSANRALGIRLYICSVWLICGGLAFAYGHHYRIYAGVEVWFFFSVSVFCFAFLYAVSEKDELSPRVRAAIPRMKILRIPAFFLYSGAASGIAWIFLMTGLTFLIMFFQKDSIPGISSKDLKIAAGFFLYSCSYAQTGLFIRRTLLARWVRTKYTWIVVLCVLLTVCISPFLYSALISSSSRPNVLLGNVFSFINKPRKTEHFSFALTWVLLISGLNFPWFIRQMSEFLPSGSYKTLTVLKKNTE